MNVHPAPPTSVQQSAQLRYLPSAHSQSTIYGTPPNQFNQQQRFCYANSAGGLKYGIKRPHLEDNSMNPGQEYGLAHRPIGFQIRHRSTDKTRGLRHFAHKVCEKVKEKGQTNYNEVADELVNEYFDQLVNVPQDPEKYQYDVRNIRRRVYDALNVLMAMNIIEKEKKEIRWVGLPTSSLAECRRLEEEKTQRQERIRQKTEQLQELIVQLVAYKSLVQRNRERERINGRPANSSILYLPYIIVSTDKKTMVECAIAPDKSEYWFNFDRPFEIHDDIEVLKRLGMAYGIDRGEVAPENVAHIKNCLPPALRDYVDQILEGTLTNRKPIKSISSTPQHGAQPLVKLDPNSPAIHPASTDSIVVRATRANLSGVAPTGDGGPIGSFLGPVNSNSSTTAAPIKTQTQSPIYFNQQNAPLARYAVIPRPVSARYYSPSIGRHFAQSSTHQIVQQPIYAEINHPPNFRQNNYPDIYQRNINAPTYIDEYEEDYGNIGYLQQGNEEYNIEEEEQIIEEEVVTQRTANLINYKLKHQNSFFNFIFNQFSDKIFFACILFSRFPPPNGCQGVGHLFLHFHFRPVLLFQFSSRKMAFRVRWDGIRPKLPFPSIPISVHLSGNMSAHGPPHPPSLH